MKNNILLLIILFSFLNCTEKVTTKIEKPDLKKEIEKIIAEKNPTVGVSV